MRYNLKIMLEKRLKYCMNLYDVKKYLQNTDLKQNDFTKYLHLRHKTQTMLHYFNGLICMQFDLM